MKRWVRGEIVAKNQWTDNLFSIQLDAPLLDFRAGQFIQVAIDIGGKRVGRPYSLVNPPDKRPLEIYFNEVPSGPLTPRLSALAPGDWVWVAERPSGTFTLERVPDCRDLWMIATGTALGVYLSILETADPWRRFEKVVLVHGCRRAEDLTYADRVAGLGDRFADQFDFVPLLSREHHPDALHGRVTDLLEDGTLERRLARRIDPAASHVMLCGNSAMIKDVSALLDSRGMLRNRAGQNGQYTTEQYH